MTANKHTPMVVAAARALCRRASEVCNVDFDDNWKLYSDDFLADAQVTLEAAAAPELLEAAQAAMNCIGELPPTQARVEAAQLLTAAIAKATGGAA